MSATVDDVPPVRGLIDPILQVLRNQGGSASNTEIESGIREILNLPDDILDVTIRNGRPRLRVRLSMARSQLKESGYINNHTQGVWSLTRLGSEVGTVDQQQVTKVVEAYREARHENPQPSEEILNPQGDDDSDDGDSEWGLRVRKILGSMPPDDFEKFCGIVLRNSGFAKVDVTGKSGDGGIDGNGIVQINSLISFPILFQCKRYVGSVGSSAIRDFRGAMQGRADRGVIMTTGTFSPDAKKEASRDGAPPIDLVDGDGLIALLASLGLGLKKVTRTEVDVDWWKSNFVVTISDDDGIGTVNEQ